MKLSVYNNLVMHKDGTILHNLVTGAMILLTPKTLEVYQEFETGNFSNKKAVEQLQKLGFIVEEIDERVELQRVYEQKRSNSKRKHLYIVTTDQCNLGCHYCYEEKNQWIKMSLETQEQTKEFLTKMCLESETEKFGITWYGGEPTLNMEAVRNIGVYAGDLCKNNNIKFHQSMVTNGTTINSHMADELVSIGIKNYQITVDGFKDDHDNSRPYLKDITAKDAIPAHFAQRAKMNLPILDQATSQRSSSYDAIIKGLKHLVDRGCEISLRMNCTSKNIDRLTILLDDLFNKGFLQKNEQGGLVKPYAHPVFEPEYISEKSLNIIGESNCGSCSNNKMTTMSKRTFAEISGHVNKWFDDHNLNPRKQYHRLKFYGDTCTAGRLFEYVINPDGTLVKCTHHAGCSDKAIGHIQDLDPNPNTKNMEGRFHQFDPFKDEECANCSVLPICLGGCKSTNMVDRQERGSFDSGCILARFTLPEDIKQLYEGTLK